MKMNQNHKGERISTPTLQELEKELERERRKENSGFHGLKNAAFSSKDKKRAARKKEEPQKKRELPPLEVLEKEWNRERSAIVEAAMAAEAKQTPQKSASAAAKPAFSLKALLPGKKAKKDLTIPPVQELEKELKWERYKDNYLSVLRSTIYTLITVSAVAVLVAVLLLPVLQIYGTSMTPTLYEGNIVVSMKGSQFETGDVIAFYYNNRILVKRVIGQSGEWIDIDEDGIVSVNREVLDEPYVSELAFGECDIDLPYQVPESRIFVMGDHRSVSVDSRSSTVGCIAEEQIVGKIVFRVWPLEEFGVVR